MKIKKERKKKKRRLRKEKIKKKRKRGKKKRSCEKPLLHKKKNHRKENRFKYFKEIFEKLEIKAPMIDEWKHVLGMINFLKRFSIKKKNKKILSTKKLTPTVGCLWRLSQLLSNNLNFCVCFLFFKILSSTFCVCICI